MRIPLFASFLLALALPSVATDTLEFTTVHTPSSNWLSIVLHPLSGCRAIVVDSTKVADDVTAASNGTTIVRLGPPRRQVQVWWHLDSLKKDYVCASSSEGARHMARLPDPRKSPGNDTLLRSWIAEAVVSHGPDGGEQLLPANLVDQAGNQEGRLCPVYDCYFHIDTVAPPVQEVRDSLESWIRVGGSLVLATSGGAPVLVEGDIQDSALVLGLGRVSPWNVGNQAWHEVQSIQVLQSWGEPVPRTYLKATGRRVYKWTGVDPTVCCQHCDSLCVHFPPYGRLVYTGEDLVLSNDSTQSCRSEIDGGMSSDLRGRWLLRPTREETASETLGSTFSYPGVCGGGRIGAFRVVDDSLLYRAGKYALADLLPISGVHPRGPLARTRIQAIAGGWRVSGATGTRVVLRDLQGRILFDDAVDREVFVPAPRHGAFLLRAGDETFPLVR